MSRRYDFEHRSCECAQVFCRIAAIMPYCFIKRCEKPVVGGAKNNQCATYPQSARSFLDLNLIILDVFKHVDVHDAIKVRSTRHVSYKTAYRLCTSELYVALSFN